MKNHRDMCRNYAKLYQVKLTKKSSVELEEQLTDYEKNLDIFNLVIIRQQTEIEVNF
jgi:hypothetical protein